MSLFNFKLDNQFIEKLPADTTQNNFPRQVEHSAYSWVTPKITHSPKLIAYSISVAKTLGLSEEQVLSDEFKQLFSGNSVPEGFKPYAMCYGGHQFGHWAGQLGDGRAINLAEIQTDDGHRVLQLKGAGPTPYSRTADGLAVLRSSIREFLCSEAMFYLGIPTTRALSLSLTGDSVVRDMFYDGNAKSELGAVVCRVSSSFMRFGSFELPASRQDAKLLSQLVHYSITRDFPELINEKGDLNLYTLEQKQSLYIRWLEEIAQRTCKLIIHWQRVGFVHGVMNTDNLSIIGETIDYGPYGWIDDFDLSWTPNTTDAQGKRYCFGKQAEIGQWNLYQLANALFLLLDDAKPLEAILNNYAKDFQNKWQLMMCEKLGLSHYNGEDDLQLFLSLEELLTVKETDMTIFYRLLGSLPENNELWLDHISESFYQEALTDDYKTQFFAWFDLYAKRLLQEELSSEQRKMMMNKVNPKFVLRNYLSQQAIELAEKGDFSMLHNLQGVLQHPYDENETFSHFAHKRPDWARNKAGCSMLSCSS